MCNTITEILDKLQFFGGQRAGRELWADKPTDVQDTDIEAFSENIEAIRCYIHQLEKQNRCFKESKESCEKRMIELAQRTPLWISVKERLPELFTRVLVTVQCKSDSEFREIKISSRYTPIGGYHTDWRWGCDSNEEVTHWMPLPEPPKEATT